MFGLNKKQQKPDYELVKWADGRFSVRNGSKYFSAVEGYAFTQPEHVIRNCMMPEADARAMYELLCDGGEVVSSCVV
jgi:hypothetical protein